MRQSSFHRKTSETDLTIDIRLEGRGAAEVDSGIGFLDHMLAAFALQGRFDLKVRLRGDLQVNAHHSLEDLGTGLGSALREALAEKRGIERCGFAIFPMDESLATVAVDLSGRPCLRLDCPMAQDRVGQLPVDLVEDFLLALAAALPAAIHAKVEGGRSAHHQIEALFKSLGRALHQACRIDPALAGEVPSTKGIL